MNAWPFALEQCNGEWMQSSNRKKVNNTEIGWTPSSRYRYFLREQILLPVPSPSLAHSFYICLEYLRDLENYQSGYFASTALLCNKLCQRPAIPASEKAERVTSRQGYRSLLTLLSVTRTTNNYSRTRHHWKILEHGGEAEALPLHHRDQDSLP